MRPRLLPDPLPPDPDAAPGRLVPGRLVLGPAPAGLPDPNLQPPSVAAAGDPFTSVRVLHLVARIERGRPVRIADVAGALEAVHLDWTFDPSVVADILLQLQANWMADYRNAGGIVVVDGPYGPTVAIEDSSRVDPWLVRQVGRAAAACREELATFSRRSGRGAID